MSKKKPVMSHDPLAAVADVDDADSSINGDAEPTTGDGPANATNYRSRVHDRSE